MDYFHYTYKHNHIDFNSDIYKVSTYHYNWHSGVEILILLKGRIDMSCNSEVFTMEPLDTIIISPQVGHATLALEEDTTALVIHVSKEFFQYFDPNFGMYQFVLRSDKTNRDNEFFTSHLFCLLSIFRWCCMEVFLEGHIKGFNICEATATRNMSHPILRVS